MSPAGRVPSVLIICSALLVAAATLSMAQAGPATASQWLEKVAPGGNRAREPGCWRRPWVCSMEEGSDGGGGGGWFPPALAWKKMCCGNRCVDVSGDTNNCGGCGVRCPFSWTCCGGVCVDPNSDPFHCGACNNRCAFGSLCAHGMCGYAQYPSFPFPHHPAFPATRPRDGGATPPPPPQK